MQLVHASARAMASQRTSDPLFPLPGPAGFSATIARMSPPAAGSPSGAAPELSILLPVRDGAATLRAALDSTLASVGPSFEILCVDDGSRDGTAALLVEYARRDARVRVLMRPARGIVAAL